MDRNLFILKRKEHILVQDIDQKKCFVLGRAFDFELTRNSVDLIIVSEKRDTILQSFGNSISEEEIKRITENGKKEKQDFENELEEEERRIREAIDGELRRRKDEEFPEERPHLPNYEDIESQEPHYGDWGDDYDDFPYDDNEELDTWIKEHENHRIRGAELMCDYENFYADCYSNYQLKLLDDRIGQIRHYRSRLYAGNLLGYFTRYMDKNKKEKVRTIRLFLDNIESVAISMNVDRIEILANVYIHELFHAYYSQALTKRYALVNNITEVEEAMAEFGMLCYIENAFPHYLTTAIQCVQDKLNYTNLRCYGLGACLYNTWSLPNYNYGYIFDGKLLSIYQNIQLSIRNSRRKVSYLKHTLMSNVANMPYQFDYNKCIKVLYDLFYLYDYIKTNESQHHYFNGKPFGCNNKMVCAVLEYYIQKSNPTITDIENDFRLYRNPKIRWFEDIKNASPRYYDFDRQLTLPNGTTIVPMSSWTSDSGGNTVAFIKEVDRLYRTGRLDQHVLFLG